MDLTPAIHTLIGLALEEDLGRGDVTAEVVLGPERRAAAPVGAEIVAKEPLLLFGHAVAQAVFARVDARVAYTPAIADGAWVEPARGQRLRVATLSGPADALLAGERTALNFLQRLSGVASQARRYAQAVAGTKTRVVDTRKTTPGWRALEKAAVLAGGCHNHRADLGSGVLIKDNHIAACGGVAVAVSRARARAPHTLKIEVEVTTLAQVDEALAAGADIVLLDNMDLATAKEGIARAHARGVLVEISGGVTLETLPGIAAIGPDLVSVGALTHSARAMDLSLDFGPYRAAGSR
jgi:nicotinate-nucleotide pyrophosphorylase (carboxylating)